MAQNKILFIKLIKIQECGLQLFRKFNTKIN